MIILLLKNNNSHNELTYYTIGCFQHKYNKFCQYFTMNRHGPHYTVKYIIIEYAIVESFDLCLCMYN